MNSKIFRNTRKWQEKMLKWQQGKDCSHFRANYFVLLIFNEESN